MNHHAVTVREPATSRDALDVDPDLGGVVDEIHGCPSCGNVEARRVPQRGWRPRTSA
jgi:hypothetical protein